MRTEPTTPEARWIDWLRTTPEVQKALRSFCPHYFYFSYHQVVAFSGLFTKVDPLDRESLAMLADVLHEELGRDDPERVHSRLFERFAESVGLSPAEVQIDPAEVLPGVRAYVAELERAFGSGTQAEALAAYLFLESSAVDTYAPLVATLRGCGYSDEDVEFFELHAGVEPEHAAAAEAMLRRHGLDGGDPAVEEQTRRMAGLWQDFWEQIDQRCREAVGG
jgi:pyrroloquinoline quinone (PQQ) biosynthesis protein C